MEGVEGWVLGEHFRWTVVDEMGLEGCVVSPDPSSNPLPSVADAYSLLTPSLNIQAAGRATWALQQCAG